VLYIILLYLLKLWTDSGACLEVYLNSCQMRKIWGDSRCTRSRWG